MRCAGKPRPCNYSRAFLSLSCCYSVTCSIPKERAFWMRWLGDWFWLALNINMWSFSIAVAWVPWAWVGFCLHCGSWNNVSSDTQAVLYVCRYGCSLTALVSQPWSVRYGLWAGSGPQDKAPPSSGLSSQSPALHTWDLHWFYWQIMSSWSYASFVTCWFSY